MSDNYDTNKLIKLLISQTKALQKNVERTLNDSATPPHSRYVSFKSYAAMYNNIAREAERVLGLEMSRNVQSGNTQNLKSSAAPVRLPAVPAPTPGTSQAAAPAGCAYRS